MFNHYSVMLKESIELLDINPDGIYVDMTLGGAGHSQEIVKKLNKGKLFSFDQDIVAIANAREVFKDDNHVEIIQSNFVAVKDELLTRNINRIDGAIFDLGVSSVQFDEAERGFSYRFNSKLDMRMNQEQELSAYQVVNEYSFHDLMKVIVQYGEEKFAKQIARNIEKARLEKPIETTFELVDIIKSSMPQAYLRKKGHPAKKTFQAIRIEVNKELEVFEKALRDVIEMLNVNGRVVVITFHSLEDKICKRIFKEYTVSQLPKDIRNLGVEDEIRYELVKNKVVLPTDDELSENSRSKSSKLRVIKKIKEWFDEKSS